jgi:hypothetical protein
VVYPLAEILLLSLVAVLAGADGFADIARFKKKKLGSGKAPRLQERKARQVDLRLIRVSP